MNMSYILSIDIAPLSTDIAPLSTDIAPLSTDESTIYEAIIFSSRNEDQE